MTPKEFVALVQEWTSAIEQSIPFLVAMVFAITMGWNKLSKHDKALNGQLDARIESTAKKVLSDHIIVDKNGALHASSSNRLTTNNDSNSVPG